MPYSINRCAEHLVWVVLEGHLALNHAERYFSEMWDLLDTTTAPTDLLVDGRQIVGAAPGARRRTEQIAHHPNLGHLAFVVSEFHMLLFAPLVKLVSGVGLFGDEHEALSYLRAARGLPPVVDLALPNLPPQPHHGEPADRRAESHHEPFAHAAPHPHAQPEHAQRAVGARRTSTRPLPPLPASRLKQTPITMRTPPRYGEGQRAGAGDGDRDGE